MSILLADLIHQTAKLLEDEEAAYYTFNLYSMNQKDLEFFSEDSRKKVVVILKKLTQEAKQHADLLRLVVEMGAH